VCSSDLKIGLTHCTQLAGHSVPLQAFPNWTAQGVHYAKINGDIVYQDAGVTTLLGFFDDHRDMLRMFRTSFFRDIGGLAFMRSCSMEPGISDHDFAQNEINLTAWTNGVNGATVSGSWYRGAAPMAQYDDGTMGPGKAGNGSLYADATAIVPEDEYTTAGGRAANVQVGALYDAYMKAFWFGFTQHQASTELLTSPVNEPWIGTRPIHAKSELGGLVWSIKLDSRSWNDIIGGEPLSNTTGNATLLGRPQVKWFKDAIDACPATAKTLMIVLDAKMSDVNTSRDNFDDDAHDGTIERDELLQYAYDNLPASVGLKIGRAHV